MMSCRDLVAGECSVPVPVGVLHPDAQGADACGGLLHRVHLWHRELQRWRSGKHGENTPSGIWIEMDLAA